MTDALKIYYAGPLFSLAERLFNKNLRDALLCRGNYEIFLPQESDQNTDESSPMAIFMSDAEAIKNADAVVAIMDGADADSGTCWEHGYAYALKKLLIIIRTDFRVLEPTRCINLMMYDSTIAAGGKVIIYHGDSIDELADMIQVKLDKLRAK